MQPHCVQVALYVLAVEQMPKDKLVLSDGALGEDEGERPLYFVVEGEGFKHFKRFYGWLEVGEGIGVGMLRGKAEGMRTEGAFDVTNGEELLDKAIGIQLARDIVFEWICVSTRSSDCHLQEALKLLNWHVISSLL